MKSGVTQPILRMSALCRLEKFSLINLTAANEKAKGESDVVSDQANTLKGVSFMADLNSNLTLDIVFSSPKTKI